MTPARVSFGALVRRDLVLAFRQGGTGVQAVVFFAVVVTLVPFGVGADLAFLKRLGPGVVWIGFVLASLLSLDRLFQSDFEDGSIDGLVLSGLPLEGVVLAKSLAHWIANGLPLLLAAPVLGIFLNLDGPAIGALMVTLMAGTPGLTLLGAVGAALTVSVRRAGMLMGLLVLPLYVPVLIFGVGAIATAERQASLSGLAGDPSFLFLLAVSLFGLVVGTVAATAALRLQLE
jgi:heme exporter protein B